MKSLVLFLCCVTFLLFGGCDNNTTNIPSTNTTITTLASTNTVANGSTNSLSTIHTQSTSMIDNGFTTGTSEKPSTTATAPHTTTQASSTQGVSTNPGTSNTHPDTIVFKATVRDNIHQQPIGGITVTVYVDGSTQPTGSAVTNANGVAGITLHKGQSYRVVLSTLPNGYEANTDYRFTTHVVNITIRKTAVQNEQDHSQAQYQVGKTMTNFTLTDIDGQSYQLSDLLKERKLIILNFWFTGCEPCKMEFPFFEAALQKYDTDIAILAIDPIDSTDAAIISLRNQLNANPNTSISFPMLRDTCNLYLGFDVTAYPTTVFIDPNGVILAIRVGSFPNETALYTTIDQYLGS